MPDIYFISDLHLSGQTLAETSNFLAWLPTLKSGDQLYMLGDFFDAWIGDDAAVAPEYQQIIAALTSTSDRGVNLYYMHGNRDFLVGSEVARQAGMRLIAAPHLLRIGQLSLLLLHGDELCTDDAQYQQFRQHVRSPEWQASFLAKPLTERREIANGLRAQSEQQKQIKSMQIMDVNPEAVAALFRAHPDCVMIHGHTHRPACHHVQLDQQTRTRWVLPDWHGQHWGYLHLHQHQLSLHQFEA
ncbi:UDP-2,3-diacylglucosamine diphosphatase [Leeia oryzae]|uniref:UDP-2,3-diacylglucosamine diphosphatase n=1 Tax=Leeia oryzae TaxID=356662 RepID=UPI00036F29EB|nr:UDP-2,3-diacylglucosamine diphosphatase [Leeia oryzae]